MILTPRGVDGARVRRRLHEAFQDAYSDAMRLAGRAGFIGYGIVELRDGNGELAAIDAFSNLITTAGDQYAAKQIIAGVSPATPAAPTLASGMKLGTGSTAAAKSSTGAALVTYITASNNPFDASYPQAAAKAGTDTGWNATYKTTWLAGDVTNSAITEVAIVNDAGSDANSSAANTYSRAVITLVNKSSSDSLSVTWTWTGLGS
jgi:hypothetical protein